MPSEVRREVDRLTEADWLALTAQLGRYALQKSRRFYWRTGQAGDLPYGEMTESMVSKAVLLWMTGRRRWNRAEYPDLESFLKGAIDSLLSHSAGSFDNTRLASSDSSTRADQLTPERALLDRERAAAHDELLAEIVRRSSEDAVALEIIDSIRQGAVTRRAIVAATGHAADVIDNGLKRIRRTGLALARRQATWRHDTP